MNNDVSAVIEQQKLRLDEWLLRAEETSNFVAEEVCDSLEVELNSLVSDGIMWDFLDSVKHALRLELMSSFDSASEKWMIHRLESLGNVMAEVAGPAWNHQKAVNCLDGLRKGFRLNDRTTDIFDTMFRKARPGVFSLVTRLIKDELSDDLSHMEEEEQEDARRIQRAFRSARADLHKEIATAAEELLRKVLAQYRNELFLLEDKVA